MDTHSTRSLNNHELDGAIERYWVLGRRKAEHPRRAAQRAELGRLLRESFRRGRGERHWARRLNTSPYRIRLAAVGA
ncbi:hypothetical protein [Microbacterium binotii]|uniref:Integrase n=1 Tax=Microbacterium binotii TaxID=462710 RepID=A0ABP6BMF4_9MICO